MKTKTIFKIDVIEMIFILVPLFFAGVLLGSNLPVKYLSALLLFFPAALLLWRKKVRVPLHKKEVKKKEDTLK